MRGFSVLVFSSCLALSLCSRVSKFPPVSSQTNQSDIVHRKEDCQKVSNSLDLFNACSANTGFIFRCKLIQVIPNNRIFIFICTQTWVISWIFSRFKYVRGSTGTVTKRGQSTYDHHEQNFGGDAMWYAVAFPYGQIRLMAESCFKSFKSSSLKFRTELFTG